MALTLTAFATQGLLNSDTVTSITLNSTGAAAIAAASTTGYPITASNAAGTGLTNYSITYATTGTVTVNAAALTVTANAQTKQYGASDPALTYAITPGALVGTDKLTGALMRVVGESVRSYAIQQGTLAASTNYTLSYNGANLTITAAPLTVTASNATRAYGTANPSLSGSITGAVNSDSFTAIYTTSATALSDVSSYAIVSSVVGSNLSDYNVSLHNGTLSVTQAGSTTTLTTKAGTISSDGENMTLTADVVSTSSGTPTGTVSFYGGLTLLGKSALSGGTAIYTATLAAGLTYDLTAVYNGDNNFTTSTSSDIPITTTALDFTLAPPSTTVQTVIPGNAVSCGFSITPSYGNYAGTVTFSVSGLPAGATATFSPATIAANGGAQTVTMTIQTATATTQNAKPTLPHRVASLVLALLLLPLLGTKKMRRQGRRINRWLCLLFLLCGLAASAALSGCGGSYFSQAPKDYTITVTATAGSLQHNFNVTLNVQ
jgi:hypothetical protein